MKPFMAKRIVEMVVPQVELNLLVPRARVCRQARQKVGRQGNQPASAGNGIDKPRKKEQGNDDEIGSE
jgi:hypothetical protein